MDAIELIKLDLADPSFERRAAAARGTATVAASVGPERTKNELVPVLVDAIAEHKEEDELLYLIGTGILEMVERDAMDARGDDGERMKSLLIPVEVLCNSDETLTRMRACDALAAIVEKASAKYVASSVLPVLKRLSEDDDWFTPRCSAMMCAPTVYNALATEKTVRSQQVVPLLTKLVGDPTPMVTKVAARALVDFVKENDEASVVSDILPLYKKICADARVSVRVVGISHTNAFAKKLSGSAILDHLLSLVRQFSSDDSWTVRAAVAVQLAQLTEALAEKTDKAQAASAFAPIAVELLTDGMDEVRIAASDALAQIATYLGDDALSKGIQIEAAILNLMAMNSRVDRQLTSRMSVVRTSLALASIAPAKMGPHFKPLWEEVLKDSESPGHADVRRCLLAGLDTVAAAVTPEFLVGQPPEPTKTRKSIRNLSRQSTAAQNSTAEGWGKLLAEIFKSSKFSPDPSDPLNAAQNDGTSTVDIVTPKWRIRAAIVSRLDELARASQMGREFALNTWTASLSDEAKEVRVEAVDVAFRKFCRAGSGVGGPEGCVSTVVPLLTAHWKGPCTSSYQLRLAFANACAVAAEESPDVVWPALQEHFHELLDDNVLNVVYRAVTLAASHKEKIVAAPGVSAKLEELKASEVLPQYIKAEVEALVAA